MTSKELTPKKFRKELEEILESSNSMEEKINLGKHLVEVSRLYFEGTDLDARKIISEMQNKRSGKSEPRNIILNELWQHEDTNTQQGIEFQWKQE